MLPNPFEFDPCNSIHLLLDFSNKVLKKTSKTYVHECWNYRCCYCGSQKDLTIDHLRPLAKGGTNDISNLASAWQKCNLSKGNKKLEDWYKHQSFFLEERLEKIQKWSGEN